MMAYEYQHFRYEYLTGTANKNMGLYIWISDVLKTYLDNIQ
jgi:hypothetical protein